MGGARSLVTPDHSTLYKPFGEKAFYIKRALRSKRRVQIDVYGPYWGFLLGPISATSPIRVLRRGRLVTLLGNVATFLPPFSIIEWHLSEGLFQFEAVFSKLPYREKLDEPIWFRMEDDPFPASLAAILDRVRNVSDPIEIGREEFPSSLARRTKEYIDRNYQSPGDKLTFLAEKLCCTPSALSTAFRKCYGISPVKYRARLRVQESIQLLLAQGHDSVVSVAHQVGFEDLSQFNRQFRRYNQATPSRFRSE